MKGVLTIIPVGDAAVTRKELTAAPRLEELQSGVGGDIEIVPGFIRYQGEPCVAFCNEHGKGLGPPINGMLNGMPINQRATVLWFRQLSRHPEDYLVGPVVIITGDRELRGAL